MRKIIHIDMDAFYASVELRTRPHLKEQPVVIGSHRPRAVVVAASYVARQYGLHSAMPMHQAKKLCPHVVIIEPNFEHYRAVSAQIYSIFKQYTHLVEPIALDEAYLDVTTNLKNIKSATEVAQHIQHDIYQQTQLTASAGVAPNKFLAKIASDWQKPNGLFVIKPTHVKNFIHDLPLNKIPGVGKVTQTKLEQLNLYKVNDLQHIDERTLIHHFGKYGSQLYLYGQGVDERPVKAERVRQQISKEITFNQNFSLEECQPYWHPLISKVWTQLQEKNLSASGVTLKLKEANFHVIQHSKLFTHPLLTLEAFEKAVYCVLDEIHFSQNIQFRLVGVGVYQLIDTNNLPQLKLW